MPGGAQGRVDRVRKSEGLWPYLAKKLDCRIFVNVVDDTNEKVKDWLKRICQRGIEDKHEAWTNRQAIRHVAYARRGEWPGVHSVRYGVV